MKLRRNDPTGGTGLAESGVGEGHDHELTYFEFGADQAVAFINQLLARE